MFVFVDNYNKSVISLSRSVFSPSLYLSLTFTHIILPLSPWPVDIDECASRLNNCTRDQMCINNYGGFQCVRVDCSRIRNATYSKTSPL